MDRKKKKKKRMSKYNTLTLLFPNMKAVILKLHEICLNFQKHK